MLICTGPLCVSDARADPARAADVMRDYASETHRAFVFGHENMANELLHEPASSVSFDRGVDVFGERLGGRRTPYLSECDHGRLFIRVPHAELTRVVITKQETLIPQCQRRR